MVAHVFLECSAQSSGTEKDNPYFHFNSGTSSFAMRKVIIELAGVLVA